MDQTTITQGDTTVVIQHSGHSELHIHLDFTVVAATPQQLAKIGDITNRLKASGDALTAATAAAS